MKKEEGFDAISKIVGIQKDKAHFEQAGAVPQEALQSSEDVTFTNIATKLQKRKPASSNKKSKRHIYTDNNTGKVVGDGEKQEIIRKEVVINRHKISANERVDDNSDDLSSVTFHEEKKINSYSKGFGNFKELRGVKAKETLEIKKCSVTVISEDKDLLNARLTNQFKHIKRKAEEIRERVKRVGEHGVNSIKCENDNTEESMDQISTFTEFDDISRLQRNDPIYLKLAHQLMAAKKNITDIEERVIGVEDNYCKQKDDSRPHKDPMDVELTGQPMIIRRNAAEIIIPMKFDRASSNSQSVRGNNTKNTSKKNLQLVREGCSSIKMTNSRDEVAEKDPTKIEENRKSKNNSSMKCKKKASSNKKKGSRDEVDKKCMIQITHDGNNKFDYRKINTKRKKRKKNKNDAFAKRMMNYEKQKQNKIKKAQMKALYDIKVDKKKCNRCGKVQNFDEVLSNKSFCEDCGVTYSVSTKFDSKKFECRHKQSTKNRERTISRIKAERQSSLESSGFHNRLKGSVINKKRVLTKEEEKSFVKRMSSTPKKVEQQKRKSSPTICMNNSLNRRISKEDAECFVERMVQSEAQKHSNIQRARMKALYNAKVDKKRCPNCGNEQSYEEFEANQNMCTYIKCKKSDDKSKGFQYATPKKFDMNEFEKHIQEYCVQKAHNLSKIETEEVLMCFQNLQPKSRRQRELADKVTVKGGQSFNQRMYDDISARQGKLRNLNELQLQQLKVTCTFKPKLNISKKFLRRKEKRIK